MLSDWDSGHGSWYRIWSWILCGQVNQKLGTICAIWGLSQEWTIMALNSLFCAHVPLRNCSLTQEWTSTWGKLGRGYKGVSPRAHLTVILDWATCSWQTYEIQICMWWWNVDLVTDTSTDETKCRQGNRSNRLGRRLMSDSVVDIKF